MFEGLFATYATRDVYPSAEFFLELLDRLMTLKVSLSVADRISYARVVRGWCMGSRGGELLFTRRSCLGGCRRWPGSGDDVGAMHHTWQPTFLTQLRLIAVLADMLFGFPNQDMTLQARICAMLRRLLKVD